MSGHDFRKRQAQICPCGLATVPYDRARRIAIPTYHFLSSSLGHFKRVTYRDDIHGGFINAIYTD